MQIKLLALVFSAFGFPAIAPFEGHQVFRIKIETDQKEASVDDLIQEPNLNILVWKKSKIGLIDIQVPPESISLVKSRLNTDYEIIIENVQKLIDAEKDYSRELAKTESDVTKADELFKDYRDLDVYMNFLIDLPGSTAINLGKTYEGRDIRGIKFGTGAKQVVVNGGIHAREWISPATTTYLAYFLTGNDPRAISLRETFTFHIIPVLNPDGYAYTRASSSNRMWRKNREPTNGSRCVGTDINRNFLFQWSKPGASGSVCSDTYYGSSAQSTLEAQALDNYVKSLSNVVSYLDVHSYSQMWLYPWGYDCKNAAPDDKDFAAATAAGAAALKAKFGTKYTTGPSCSTIYQTSGTTDDHMYALNKVKYSITIELRDTGRNGFALPATQIVPTAEETVEGLVAFYNYISSH